MAKKKPTHVGYQLQKFGEIKQKRIRYLISNTKVTTKRLYFDRCAQAARTNVFANHATIFIKSCALNVGLELTLGLFLRETDIVARHRFLATNFTFSHNNHLNLAN